MKLEITNNKSVYTAELVRNTDHFTVENIKINDFLDVGGKLHIGFPKVVDFFGEEKLRTSLLSNTLDKNGPQNSKAINLLFESALKIIEESDARSGGDSHGAGKINPEWPEKYLNLIREANKKNIVTYSDCGICTTALLTEQSYEEVLKLLHDLGHQKRRNGGLTMSVIFAMWRASGYEWNSVDKYSYLDSYRHISNTNPKYITANHVKKYPEVFGGIKKQAWVTRDHIFPVIDGVVEDSLKNSRREVTHIYDVFPKQ